MVFAVHPYIFKSVVVRQKTTPENNSFFHHLRNYLYVQLVVYAICLCKSKRGAHCQRQVAFLIPKTVRERGSVFGVSASLIEA